MKKVPSQRPRKPAAKPADEPIKDPVANDEVEGEQEAEGTEEAEETEEVEQEEVEEEPPPKPRKKTKAAPVKSGGVGNAFYAFAIVLVIVGYLAWKDSRSTPDVAPPVTPVAPVVVGPSDELKRLVQPINEALAADSDKALKVYRTYKGFAAAMRLSGSKIGNTTDFEAIHGKVLDTLKVSGGVSVGTQIDEAIGGYLGVKKVDLEWEPKTFDDKDKARLLEALEAIAWAAEQVVDQE